jgi:hypothetical protein
MRFLGFIFVIVVILAAVGYCRGWFSVTTTHAGGRSEVTLGVDNEKISDDTKSATDRLGELSAKAVEAVKSLGRTVSANASELEGTVTAVDPAARDLTVVASSKAIDLHVPIAVPIRRDGESVAFGQLHPATRVKLSFEHAGDNRRLSRIDILH